MGEVIVLLVVIGLAVSVALRIRDRWPFIVASESFTEKLMIICRAVFDKEEPFVEAITVKEKEMSRHQYKLISESSKAKKRYKQMSRMREKLTAIAKDKKLDIYLRDVWSCISLLRGGNQIGNDCLIENGITSLTYMDKDSCKIVINKREYMIKEEFSYNNYEGKRVSSLKFEFDGEIKFQTLSVVSESCFSATYSVSSIDVIRYSGDWPLDLLDMYKATSAVREKWTSNSDERTAKSISQSHVRVKLRC